MLAHEPDVYCCLRAACKPLARPNKRHFVVRVLLKCSCIRLTNSTRMQYSQYSNYRIPGTFFTYTRVDSGPRKLPSILSPRLTEITPRRGVLTLFTTTCAWFSIGVLLKCLMFQYLLQYWT